MWGPEAQGTVGGVRRVQQGWPGCPWAALSSVASPATSALVPALQPFLPDEEHLVLRLPPPQQLVRDSPIPWSPQTLRAAHSPSHPLTRTHLAPGVESPRGAHSVLGPGYLDQTGSHLVWVGRQTHRQASARSTRGTLVDVCMGLQ